MKQNSEHSGTGKDTHGFPARTSWTKIQRLRLQRTQGIQEFCGELYLEPLRQYALTIAAELCSESNREEAQDWVLEFVEDKLAVIIRSKSTRQPEDRQPLFRHLVRKRFRQFALDKLKASAAQKRGGHLQRVELVREGQDADEIEFEPVDIKSKTAEAQFDLEWLRQHYLRAMAKAREEFLKKRKAAEFDVLLEAIENGTEFSAAETAKKLPGRSPGAIRTAKSRLQDQLGEFLVGSVAQAERIGNHAARKVLQDLFEISRAANDPFPAILAPA